MCMRAFMSRSENFNSLIELFDESCDDLPRSASCAARSSESPRGSPTCSSAAQVTQSPRRAAGGRTEGDGEAPVPLEAPAEGRDGEARASRSEERPAEAAAEAPAREAALRLVERISSMGEISVINPLKEDTPPKARPERSASGRLIQTYDAENERMLVNNPAASPSIKITPMEIQGRGQLATSAGRRRAQTTFRVGQMFNAKETLEVSSEAVHVRAAVMKRFMIDGMFNPQYPPFITYMSVMEAVGITHALYTAHDMAFGPLREPVWLLAFDCFVDALYWVEMYMQMRTALYIPSTDVFITDRRSAFGRFCKKKMKVRVLHSLPWQVMHYIVAPALLSYSAARPFKLLRGFKLLRLKSLFVETEKQVTSRTNWKKQLCQIVLRFMVVSHIIACMVYSLTFVDDDREGFSWLDHLCGQWDQDPGCHVSKSQSWMYLVCMYYSTTVITTVGFGNMMPYSEVQIVGHTLAAALGACHNAMLISSIMDVFAQYNCQRRDYLTARVELDNFLSSRALSKDLLEEIQMHFDFQWSNTRFMNENAFMERYFSYDIRRKVRREMYLGAVKGSKLFEGAPVALLIELLERVQLGVYKKDDVICKHGYYGSEVFLLVNGAARIHRRGEKTRAEASETFGHAVLRGRDAVYDETVVSLSSCDVLCIDREVLRNSLLRHTDWWPTVRQRALGECEAEPAAPAASVEWGDVAKQTARKAVAIKNLFA